MKDHADVLAGCLLGGAIGDALGLAYEGIGPRRIARLSPGPLRFRVWPGRAIVSDDTEHAAFTAQALILGGGDAVQFERALARRLRGWFAALPPGIGLATGRALIKLWLGVPPGRNAVRSAGNGPAMRAAILGAWFRDDRQALLEHVRIATRLTHDDARALAGAQIIALGAMLAARGEADPRSMAEAIAPVLAVAGEGMADFRRLMADTFTSVAAREETTAFCMRQGWQRGVQGYIVHTVAAAIHAWLSHPADLEAALAAIIRSGGDTDSTAAIVGGLVGAGTGTEGLPAERIACLQDWPWNSHRLRTLGPAMVTAQYGAATFPCWPLLLLRNLVLLIVVLGHGFRRLLPPY